jgi:hypothetical protein
MAVLLTTVCIVFPVLFLIFVEISVIAHAIFAWTLMIGIEYFKTVQYIIVTLLYGCSAAI